VYEISSKIFVSRHFIFGGVILDLDKYIFLWQTYFLHLGKYGNFNGTCGDNNSTLEMILTAGKGAYINTW